MKIAIIVSKKDTAGINIKKQLLILERWDETVEFEGNKIFQLHKKNNEYHLFTTEKDSIYCENVDDDIKKMIGGFDFLVFATRHASKAAVASLSVHAPGNWSKAEYGGRNKTLCMASAVILKTAFLQLIENAKAISGFDVIQEVTHHGPYVDTPCFFIEIGSTEKEWALESAGKIIAKTIFDTFEATIEKQRIAIGIGGLHHMPIFKKIVTRENVAISHTCPKYMLSHLSKELILEAISKTVEPVDFVALDWKGISDDKDKIISMLDGLGLKYEKYKF